MLTSTTAGGSLGRYSSLRSSSNGSSTSVYAGGSLSSATGRTPLPRRSRRLKEKQLAQNGFAPGEGGGATSTSASSSSDGDLTESATSETDGGSPRPLGRLRSIPSFTSDGEYSSSSSLSHIPRHISSPRRHRQPVKKTLILDLDETLIHSTSRGSKYHHHMVEVLVDRHVCLYYVYKRPHCDLFLRKVSEWYKVVIFTASMAEYADPVVDWLDPQRKIFAARYFRQSCLLRHGFYIKNLAVVEPDLSRVCLVDNSPISYQLNEDNGIPTDTWVGDTQDEGLLDLLPFLDALRFVEDVRHVISMK
ncbi:NLI interacting factor-like phosphatase-domain-containing protein [Fimicolochytrium jonesii]|uniref:NLI interacting factor-like phosphatase-domain-containing protein n=1 Tax=Fimicolochytrium jonesii TaxID=1396493 RepID=UPI0022FE0BB8|nr:NLI interacting factor-like phosphatase-domain-containing protein [Fimicolochytrium jonesii]KAI8823088.1 NLI interacting factor-like phosphatase-domain-containing protein [Fimicolochytrium jonesii]